MEKKIKIGDVEIPLISNAASSFVYKRNFGRDPLKDLLKLGKQIPQKKQGQEFTEDELIEFFLENDADLDIFYRFLWVFAKAANPSISPLEEWLSGFDIPALDFMAQVFPQIQDLLYCNVRTTISSKK